MEWKDIFDWIKKLLPSPLRVPFTTGVMVIAVVGLTTIFVERLEWAEVFWVWWMPFVAGIACLFWAIVTIVVRNTIRWHLAVSWIVSAILISATVSLAVFSYHRSHYRYERAGFFVLRHWQVQRERGAGYFEWTMEPTTDVSKNKIVVSMSLTGDCDLTQFEGPAPIVDPHSTHHPVISDDSTLEHPNTRWSIKDLYRGEEVTFGLVAKGENRSADLICIAPIVNSN